MSLVLDALRRQQSEDDQGTAVALALANERQRRQRTWLIVLSTALFLNAVLFAWLFRDRLVGLPTHAPAPVASEAASNAPTAPAAPIPQTQAGASAAELSGSPPPGTAPGNVPGNAPGMVPAAPPGYTASGYPPPTTGSAPPTAGGTPPPYGYPTPTWAPPPGYAPQPLEAPPRVLERIALDALPPAARSRFPGIVISTHVYAEDPALRAIVVNGERLQEGQQVAGTTIREINEFGVVLEFESYLVDVPVFTDWEQ